MHLSLTDTLLLKVTLLLWGICCAGSPVADAQAGSALPNLVPNPSFELYSSPPIGWFYKGEHFTKVMKYWHSPTAASPDVYGPKVRVPAYWKSKGFGDQLPRSGTSMVGLTVYGCQQGKPHCREYIQIALTEPLVVGQTYAVEFWTTHLPQGLRINRLGAAFSVHPMRIGTDALLPLDPQLSSKDVIDSPQRWTKVRQEFVATQEAAYLVIGNFFADSLTQTTSAFSHALDYAYYYIDDVSVRKVEPLLPVPARPHELLRRPLKKGDIVQLRNLFFDVDKDELLPRSYEELAVLTAMMQKRPTMTIEIRGHTDSDGDDAHNKELSRRRAKAVVQYLTEQGIGRARMRYIGFGESKPITTNDTPEGRQQNRRVEFVLLTE